MRIRTRDLIKVINPVGPMTTTTTVASSGALYSIVGPSAASPSTIVQSHTVETMTDDTSPRKGRKSQYVHHVRRARHLIKMDMDTYVNGGLRSSSVGPNAHWQAWGQYAIDIDERHVAQEIPIDEESAVRETMHAFFDRNEVDLLLNAIESPELYTGLQHIHKQLKLDSVEYHDAMRPGELRRKLARRTNILTGGFLYYSFGVAPIISDMRKLSKAMGSLKESIAKAAKRAGTEITVRRRYDGRFTGVNPNPGGGAANLISAGYGVGPGAGFFHIDIESNVKPLYICTVKGVNTFRFGSDLFNKMDYLANRFGSSGPASFAWERIPFSFVLDWFVDLSGIIDYLDNALTGNHKVISDCCVSHKWDCTMKVIHHQSSPSNSETHNNALVATVGCSAYSRKPSRPHVSVGLRSGFGKQQFRVTAALLGQMVANLKKIAR